MRVRKINAKLIIDQLDDHESLMLSSALSIAASEARKQIERHREVADEPLNSSLKRRRASQDIADKSDAAKAWEEMRGRIETVRQGGR